MRFIPTRFHGILDYVVSLLMIASPWYLRFADNAYATWTIVIAGAVILFLAIFTDFEVGIAKKIAMQPHLMLEFGVGVILALSPWLFGFANHVYTPHLIAGVFLILDSLATHRVPSREYKTHVARENPLK